MRVLLIDNEDSFTWNLFQQIAVLGASVQVVSKNDLRIADVSRFRPDRIVISPGPGHPSDADTSCRVIEKFHSSIPILGVCLGHQCLATVFDSTHSKAVIRAPQVMHGKTSKIFHDRTGLMRGIPSPFTAARYHSLIASRVPDNFKLMCWTGSQQKPDLIMGIRHTALPVFGVQFHPESFMTKRGKQIIQNFLSLNQ